VPPPKAKLSRRQARLQRTAHIAGFGGEKQLRAECRDVGMRTLAACEGGAADVQMMMLDRIENA
jgi:hypothetical protein